MKKSYVLLLFAWLCVACNDHIQPADTAKINGYWEIEKVVLPDGETKDYNINETYDFFEIHGNQGTRTKVMPQLDGKFLTNGIAEKITIIIEKDEAFIDYQTDYAKWRETIVKLGDSQLVLRNPQKNEYHYKRTGPINLNTNGKKAQ